MLDKLYRFWTFRLEVLVASRLAAAAMSTGRLRDVLALFETEDTVRALAPDMSAVAVVARRDGIRGDRARGRPRIGR